MVWWRSILKMNNTSAIEPAMPPVNIIIPKGKLLGEYFYLEVIKNLKNKYFNFRLNM